MFYACDGKAEFSSDYSSLQCNFVYLESSNIFSPKFFDE